MTPSINFIKEKFAVFNTRMFGGRLPEIPMMLSDSGRFLGQCVSRQTTKPDGSIIHSDFSIRINKRIDLPENVIEDVIIHEMIHYFIMLHGLRDTSQHGDIFKSIMRGINTGFNRNISIRHQFTPDQQEQSYSTRKTWHIIAAITMRNGEYGVKVLPRVIPKIIAYRSAALKSQDVRDIELYLSDNPFFNRYPNSAALRVHGIDRLTLETNLAGARRLRVNGNKLEEVR